MSSGLRFSEFSPAIHTKRDVYGIGATPEYPNGVAADIAAAVGYELTPEPDVANMGGLIGLVGKEKTLQDNIAPLKEKVGDGEEATEAVRGWSERSGLLEPVERLFSTAEPATGDIDLAIITGGVRNWIQRRASRLAELAETRSVDNVLLVAGSRGMAMGEGWDVQEDMTEADYMKQVIAPLLGELGIQAEVKAVEGTDGAAVMQAAVTASGGLVDMSKARIAVVSNAGNWPQNGGKYLRAAKDVYPGFDADGDQFEVTSDAFPLGNGQQLPVTHQNPFSAVGQIAHNLREFTRQAR